MKKTILLLSLAIILSGCSLGNNWTGFYYPDKNNIGDESKWIIQPGLKTLQDCRDWVAGVADNNPEFDYECGYKCKYDKDYELNICKKTEE